MADERLAIDRLMDEGVYTGDGTNVSKIQKHSPLLIQRVAEECASIARSEQHLQNLRSAKDTIEWIAAAIERQFRLGGKT